MAALEFGASIERRDPASVVTALALDAAGERAFVGEWEEGGKHTRWTRCVGTHLFTHPTHTGTSDGVLEEWAVPAGAARGVLGVRRHVSSSKKVR